MLNENKDRRIDIVYCTDDNFVDVCCTSIVSLLENKGEENIFLHIIDNSISNNGREKIIQIANRYPKTCLEFLPFPQLEKIMSVKVKFNKSHLSISTFGRLFLDNLISREIERIIYLDCDTIVLQSLLELCMYDLKGYIIGGVDDCKSKRYRQVLGLMPDALYVNAGVLLIDMKKWREQECGKKVIKYIEKYNGVIHFEDQGTINAALNSFLVLLPLKYNVMTHNFDMKYKELMRFRNPVLQYSPQMIKQAVDDPCIIHFTSSFLTNGRVWNENTNHRKKVIYNQYMKKSTVGEKEYLPSAKNKIKEYLIKSLPTGVIIVIGYLAHEIIEPIRYFCKMRVAEHEKK